MKLTSFAIEPYQLASYRDSLDGLESRQTNFWASYTHPSRLISRTRHFSFEPIRQELRLRSAPLDDLRELIPCLEAALEQPTGPRMSEVQERVRRRLDALHRATAILRNAKEVQAVLTRLADGYGTPAHVQTLLDGCTYAVWRWRWYANYRRAYHVMEQDDPPLAIDHFFLTWVDDYTNVEALQQTLKHTFLLPDITSAPLPALFYGRYQEEATYLAPEEPGQPFMCVLTGWDTRGDWDLTSLSGLLMSDHQLALAVDIHTLPRGKAIRATTNAWNVLKESVSGQYAVKDARAERAFHAVNHVMDQLDVQSLHEVAFAVLLQAPTLEALNREAQTLRDGLGMRLRLDRVAGAQAEYLKFFLPVPASTITAPVVRRNTLSHGVAVKTPWGIRKSTRLVGAQWGYDSNEGMPIHYNPWGATGVENTHLMMVGKSGSGKTVTLQALALRQAVEGNQIIMFDPVGKCKLLCDAVGAGAIYHDVETDAAINILDPLTRDPGRQLDYVTSKLSIILGRALNEGGRIRFLLRELDNFEIGAIDQALQTEGVYGMGHRRLRTLRADNAPLLEDLVAGLKQVATDLALPQAEHLAREIELRVLGSRANIFNAHTTLTWDFSADVVAYNFKEADPALLPLYYAHGFEALNRWVRSPERKRRRQPLIAIIDEYYFMASVKALESYVALATKTWRNYSAAMWTADQNSTTYFGKAGNESEWAAFTTNNTLLKFFFRQEGSEAEVLGHAYQDHLAPEDIQTIKTSGKAECIAMLGDEVHKLTIQLTDQEAYFFLRDDAPAGEQHEHD